MPWTIYDNGGQRKYLTKAERTSFLRVAERREPAVRSFCWIIALTGCRISEALALSKRNIDFETQNVIIECLKKRGKRVFRAIPLPAPFLSDLESWIAAGVLPGGRLWPWSRMTGYRRIREVMEEAGITGTHATPKGLRHGFGVCAIQSSIPLNLVQRWLGHADIKTTAIYTSAIGPEEREIASRMWNGNTNALAGEAADGDQGPSGRALAAAMPSSSPSEGGVTRSEGLDSRLSALLHLTQALMFIANTPNNQTPIVS